jgi:IS1 family transposase
MAGVPNKDKRIAVIGAMAEGPGIRSIERRTSIHRDTIMRLGVRIGQGCTRIMDATTRNLVYKRLDLDEIWGFIGKKDRSIKNVGSPEVSSIWAFCAIDSDSKLVPAFKVGHRTAGTAQQFAHNIADRVAYRIQLATDGMSEYREAVEKAFGGDVDFGRIIKTYGLVGSITDHCRYSAPEIVTVEKKHVTGHPDFDLISNSYVERPNATTRHHIRRLTRLTMAFRKKREDLEAAVGLHFAYYNFVRRYSSLRSTPAMAARVTRDFRGVGDLLGAAA